jgi:ABC-type proline/glycine betaine transport system permease subunit
LGRSVRGEIMTSIWSTIALALAAVITAVWIGALGFGLMHLIEQMI